MPARRLAFVTDIHGNLPALEAAWAEISAAAPDRVLDLGDIASGPLWPRETVQWLMAREAEAPGRWLTIAGNHERQLLAPDLDRMGASDRFARRALGPAELAWIATLPKTRQVEPDVFACHGTPASDVEYFLETVTPDFGLGGSRGLRGASPAEARARAAAVMGNSLVACGHTHHARLVAVPDGPLVINPGSVGLPAYDDAHPHPHYSESGSPHARWALAERTPEGWRVELRATAYDWQRAAERAEANGRGDWADALRTGFMGRTEADAMAEQARRPQSGY